MTNEELLEELRQDMIDEARRDELHEYNMRANYDNFLEYYEDEVTAFQDAYYKLRDLHQQFGWEFDIMEVL